MLIYFGTRGHVSLSRPRTARWRLLPKHVCMCTGSQGIPAVLLCPAWALFALFCAPSYSPDRVTVSTCCHRLAAPLPLSTWPRCSRGLRQVTYPLSSSGAPAASQGTGSLLHPQSQLPLQVYTEKRVFKLFGLCPTAGNISH